ncbi:MAG: thiamine pyrophosphate-binding protein [Deltaproteobacteria bacterium]|nr:thiamine pyrophosphate-binding protein [Deltaproteobacteria bacterium]MBW2152233.1 thiamine pyrophosphate-binding protein [Deltaproteobacteria bacterium]
MEELSGCNAFMNILEDEGVEYIFGNPGTTEIPIMDCLIDHPRIKYVLGLQEAVAMAMADGYSRASGKLSCANFHVAPGLGNAIGAIYNANFFGSPVIVTAGQQEHGFSITEPLLYHQLVPMAQPVVKWATEVHQPQEIPRILRRAAKVALTPPTGPVFVSLPGDVLKSRATMSLGALTRVDSKSRPSAEALKRLADRLLASEHPVIIAGLEVYLSDAFEQLAAVAELLGSAVFYQSVPSVAVFFTEHPLFMGELTRNQSVVKEKLAPYDLLFMVGGDGLRMSLPGPVEPLPAEMPIVQVGNRVWEIGKNYPAEIALVADVKETLTALIPILEEKQTLKQIQRARQRSEEIQRVNWTTNRKNLIADISKHQNTKPIQPDYLMMEICRNLPEEAVIVEEGISSTRNLFNFLSVKDRFRFFGMASGGIGWGIAAAVGVKLALPHRPLVAIIGDGSSMYGIQALWSAANQGLQIAYIITNNSGYSILKQRTFAYGGSSAASGRTIGMDLTDPSIGFVQLAAAMGVSGLEVSEPEAIGPALQTALDADGPFLLNVKIQDISKL